MIGLEHLIAEYPGDERWNAFVESCGVGWDQYDGKTALMSKLQDEDIAVVLNHILGNNALDWLQSQVPALNGMTPLDVLANGHKGKIVIRSLLMRMPM